MFDLAIRIVLRLYPREFRDRFGDEIASGPCPEGGSRIRAIANLIGAALLWRLRMPSTYSGVGAVLIASVAFLGAAAAIPRLPVVERALAVYVVMFGAVFFVLFATLFLSVVWLQCSKSRI